MTKIIMLSGAALLALASAALAQPPGGPRGPGAQRPDRDADVTRQQVIERADRMFAALDANNDGRFTPEEARQRGEQRRTQHMAQMFDHMDLDHNGSITREEMNQAHAQHRGGAGRADHGPGGGADGPGGPGGPGMRHRGPGGPGGGPGMGGRRGQRLFGEQGFATREQFRTRALARFDRADADHDGIVTAAERQAARGQMRERRQRPG